MVIEIPPGKAGRRDHKSTRRLKNVGDDVLALPSHGTPFAMIQKPWRFGIHAQTGDIGRGEGRERYRRDIRRGEGNSTGESVARFLPDRVLAAKSR
jgi:hypothetical protein